MSTQKMVGIGLLVLGLLVELIVVSFSANGLSALFPVGMSLFGVSIIVYAAYLVETSKLALAGIISMNKGKGIHMPTSSKLMLTGLTYLMIIVTAAGTWSYFKQTNNSHYQVVDNATLEIVQLSKENINLVSLQTSVDDEYARLENENMFANNEADKRLAPFIKKAEDLAVDIEEAYDAREIATHDAITSIDKNIEKIYVRQKQVNDEIKTSTKNVLYFIVKAQDKASKVEEEIEVTNAELQKALAVGSLGDPDPIRADLSRLIKKLHKAEDKLEDLMDDKDENIARETSEFKKEIKSLASNLRELNSQKLDVNDNADASNSRIARLQDKLNTAEDSLDDKRDQVEMDTANLVDSNRVRITEIKQAQRDAVALVIDNNKKISELEVVTATTLSQVGPAKSIADAFGIDGRTAGSILSMFYTIPLVLFGYFMVTFGIKTMYSGAPSTPAPATPGPNGFPAKKGLFGRKKDVTLADVEAAAVAPVAEVPVMEAPVAEVLVVAPVAPAPVAPVVAVPAPIAAPVAPVAAPISPATPAPTRTRGGLKAAGVGGQS